MFHELLNLILHLKEFLNDTISQHGNWVYAILFVIVFCETGLVVTPILPGDSLLFVVGTFAHEGSLNVWMASLVLVIAAILGDAVNYSIGKFLGPRALQKDRWFLKRAYLDRTHQFFEKYGGKTIIIARFVPIVRTFAPFMAGVGTMNYLQFASYNVVGAIVWVAVGVGAGYVFGSFPWVEKHFELVVVAIIVISLLPGVFEWWRHRKEQKAGNKVATNDAETK